MKHLPKFVVRGIKNKAKAERRRKARIKRYVN